MIIGLEAVVYVVNSLSVTKLITDFVCSHTLLLTLSSGN